MSLTDRRETDQAEGDNGDEKLKVLASSLMASRDLAESLDGECPNGSEVLAHIRSALAILAGTALVLLALIMLSGLTVGDYGAPLLS